MHKGSVVQYTYKDQGNQKKAVKLTRSRVMESSLNLKIVRFVGLYCTVTMTEKLFNSHIEVE